MGAGHRFAAGPGARPRACGAERTAVNHLVIHLVDRLGQLLAHADAEQAKAIVRHIALTGASGQNATPDETDRTALADRVSAALAERPDTASTHLS